MKHDTTIERTSERELIVTRTFDAPPAILFDAWTKPELLTQWWTPKSFGITFVSCEADVRTGGTYRFVFSHPDIEQPMAFFGRYLDVAPDSRIEWTNEEDDVGVVSTVTFEEQGDQTLLTLRELYPTKQALDDAMASGSTATSGAGEQFDALAGLISSLDAA